MIKIGSLFSGIGGLELGLTRAIPNSRIVWQVEQNPYCQKILRGHYPTSKLYSDIRKVKASELDSVEVVCGGFPCQDVSEAGKGRGLAGSRSGLWTEMYRILKSILPKVIVIENVLGLLRKERGMHVILRQLHEIGYDAEWSTVSAVSQGGPHRRERVFIVAYPSSFRRKSGVNHFEENSHIQNEKRNVSEKDEQRCGRIVGTSTNNNSNQQCYWQKVSPPPQLCRVDDGIPDRLDRIKALGNSVVPQCSEYVGRLIYNSGLLT